MKFAFSLLGLVAGSLAVEITNRCGTPPPSEAFMRESAIEMPADERSRRIGFQVETYVHVVTTAANEANYTQAIVDRQIDVMNDAYAPAGISFKNLGTTFTVNDEWAAARARSPAEMEMKSALRQGTYETLNLYFLSDLGGGLLGFCYFPEKEITAEVLTLDGCINLAGSMPGGEREPYDLGLTAVHEVGHWLGVYHVFQNNSCEGKGDYVFDTPMQRNATRGCPAIVPDSCPDQPGLDSINNYMDYSTDICMTEFTFGQHLKMYKTYFFYRFLR